MHTKKSPSTWRAHKSMKTLQIHAIQPLDRHTSITYRPDNIPPPISSIMCTTLQIGSLSLMVTWFNRTALGNDCVLISARASNLVKRGYKNYIFFRTETNENSPWVLHTHETLSADIDSLLTLSRGDLLPRSVGHKIGRYGHLYQQEDILFLI